MHPQIDEYIKLLKQHDWTYDYSDDHRAWTKGKEQRKVLTQMQQVMDPHYKVWNEHCMDMYKVND